MTTDTEAPSPPAGSDLEERRKAFIEKLKSWRHRSTRPYVGVYALLREAIELFEADAATLREQEAEIARLRTDVTGERHEGVHDGYEAGISAGYLRGIEEAARKAEERSRICEDIAQKHPSDSPSRDRMQARAREATQTAEDIRALTKEPADAAAR